MNIPTLSGSTKMGGAVFVAILIFFCCGIAVYAGAQGKDQQLNDKVFSLIQQCDATRSKDELLAIIAEIETLTELIEEGQHPKKKLYIIRLKKSRNMCQYLLQLQE